MRGVRTLDPIEHRELRLIAQVQKLNCYPQIIRRLTEGESGRSVARWASKLQIEGAAGHWSYWHWEKLIQALAKQVRRAKEKLSVRKLLRPAPAAEPPVPPAIAVQEHVEEQVTELECRDAIPASAQQIWMHVERTMKKLKSEQVLKYAICRQIERIERLMAMEKTLNMPLSFGHKEIKALGALCDSLLKLEISEVFRRGKGGFMPPPGDDEQSEIVQMGRQFDEIDRNLMIQATEMVMNMAQEVSSDRVKGGLDADAPGEVSAEVTAREPGIGGTDVV